MSGNKVDCFGGNTSGVSSGSQDNGDGVYRTTRNIYNCDFVKWHRLLDASLDNIVVGGVTLNANEIITSKTFIKPEKATMFVGPDEYEILDMQQIVKMRKKKK